VDDPNQRGRKALDRALAGIIDGHAKERELPLEVSKEHRELVTDVCGDSCVLSTDPSSVLSDRELGKLNPDEVVHKSPEHQTARETSWREEFEDSSIFLWNVPAKERLVIWNRPCATQTAASVWRPDADDSAANITLAKSKSRWDNEAVIRPLSRARIHTPFSPYIFVSVK